jgi:hypothetical protein
VPEALLGERGGHAPDDLAVRPVETVTHFKFHGPLTQQCHGQWACRQHLLVFAQETPTPRPPKNLATPQASMAGSNVRP